MQSLFKAQNALSRACFSILISNLPYDDATWGTGFFISRDGFALTAYHNLPCELYRSGKGKIDIYYQDKWLTVECIGDHSNADSDIAVLKLIDTRGIDIRWLQPAYLDLKSTCTERYQFWAGRSVCAYGFPSNSKLLEDRFVDGNIDSGQPILKISEIEKDDHCGMVIKKASRLQFISRRSCRLYGISGAPVMDRETGLVVAVQGSYDPYCDVVYVSDLCALHDNWNYFSKHAVALCPTGWKNRVRQQWTVRKGLFAYRWVAGNLPTLA